MKKIIIILFVAISSMHAAELPYQHLTLEQDIDWHTALIRALNNRLDKVRTTLSEMKIRMIVNKYDNIELHCGKVSNKPIYTIDVYNINQETLKKVMMQCFENNKFNEEEKITATYSITDYIKLYRAINRKEAELVVLRKNLERYKKPALRHPNT